MKPFLAAILLATACASASAACTWDRPGANPYRGDVPGAVDSYTDIPAATRAALKFKMSAHDYDDIVVITRDSITGKYRYNPTIRDMHFGSAGKVCRFVTTSGWPKGTTERGLVYCADGVCILVPTICNNVSRIGRLESPEVVSMGVGGAQAWGPIPAPVLPPFVAWPAPLAQNPLVSQPPINGWPNIVPIYPIWGGGCCGYWQPERPVIPAVPEPASWALALAGLGVIVWKARSKA